MFEYIARARHIDLSGPGPDDLRLLEERDRSLEQWLKDAGCPFEYHLRWGADQLGPDRLRQLEEHDRDLEAFLTQTLGCPFEFPVRWEQMADLSASERDRLFEERDRALEQYLKECPCGDCPTLAYVSASQVVVPTPASPVTPSVVGGSLAFTDLGSDVYRTTIVGSAGDLLIIAVKATKAATFDVPIGFSISGLTPLWTDDLVISHNTVSGTDTSRLYVKGYTHPGGGTVDVEVANDPGASGGPGLIHVASLTVADGEYSITGGGLDNQAAATSQVVPEFTGAAGGLWLQIAAQYPDPAAVMPAPDTGTDELNGDFTADADSVAFLSMGSAGTNGGATTWTAGSNFQLASHVVEIAAAANFTHVDHSAVAPQHAIVATNSSVVVEAGNRSTVTNHLTLTARDTAGDYWMPDGGVVAWVIVTTDNINGIELQDIASGTDSSPGASPWGLTGVTLPATNGSWIPLSVFGRERAAGALDSDTPLFPSRPWVRRSGGADDKYDVYMATASSFSVDATWAGATTPDRWDALYKAIICSDGIPT